MQLQDTLTNFMAKSLLQSKKVNKYIVTIQWDKETRGKMRKTTIMPLCPSQGFACCSFFQIHLWQPTHWELQHFLWSLDDSLVGQLYFTTVGTIPNHAWSQLLYLFLTQAETEAHGGSLYLDIRIQIHVFFLQNERFQNFAGPFSSLKI